MEDPLGLGGGVRLGDEGVIGVWGGGLRAKFGQGFPCFKAISSLKMSLGGYFGPSEEGFSGEVIFGGWEDLRSKFGKVFPCLEAFFVLEKTKDFFGLEGSKMGGAGVSCAREDEEVMFEQGFP